MSGMIQSKGIQMRWILREYDFRSTRQMPWDDASKGAPGHPTDVSWDDYVYGSRLAKEGMPSPPYLPLFSSFII